MTKNAKVRLIRQARRKMKRLDKKRFKLFDKTCRKLGFPENHEGWLFDYVFNGMSDPRTVLAKDEKQIKLLTPSVAQR